VAGGIGRVHPSRYRGYPYDSETGRYYLQGRYYDPEVGRFVNVDKQLSPQLGHVGLNLYAYCLNDPVNMADPSGDMPFFVVTAVIGAVVGAVVGGVIAAANGRSVLAGVVVGAAVGGLAGLGLGAAAGAMFAGSFTASASAVWAGFTVASATVAANGLGAGAQYIWNNVKEAFGVAQPLVSNGVGRGASPNAIGRAGEQYAGTLNTPKTPINVGGRIRIPDGLNATDGVLTEVKNVSHLPFTSQMRDYVTYAKDNGYSIRLWVRQGTTFSGPMHNAMNNGGFEIKLFPW
jgi:RHS repeat-associated protein